MGKRWKALLGWVAAGVLWPGLVCAQISPTYTFINATIISADEVNANFALLTNALNRTGGTMTGTLTSRDITPNSTATYDLGTSGVKFRSAYFSSTVNADTVSLTTLTCTGCVSTTQIASAYSNLYAALADNETVTGTWVFENADGLRVLDSNASHPLILTTSSNLTANRTLTLVPGDSDRTLTLSGNATLNQDVSTTALPTFAGVVLDRFRAYSTSENAAGRATLSGTTPIFELYDSDAAVDAKYGRWNGANGVMSFETVDDAYTTAASQWSVSRAGDMSFKTMGVTSHTSKSASTNYQAASDGIVFVMLDASAGTGDVLIESDASSPPTTDRCRQSVLNNYGSCAAMVKKGDYYRVTVTTSAGSISTTIDWMPFGTGG